MPLLFSIERMRTQNMLQFVKARKRELDVLSRTLHGAQKSFVTLFLISVNTNDVALHNGFSPLRIVYS